MLIINCKMDLNKIHEEYLEIEQYLKKEDIDILNIVDFTEINNYIDESLKSTEYGKNLLINPGLNYIYKGFFRISENFINNKNNKNFYINLTTDKIFTNFNKNYSKFKIRQIYTRTDNYDYSVKFFAIYTKNI
jgi:hypothetical protein